MNIHEYQAKKIFEQYGIKIPKGKIAHIEYIGNKLNITFEDKKLVKIVKYYNDGSIEVEERT